MRKRHSNIRKEIPVTSNTQNPDPAKQDAAVDQAADTGAEQGAQQGEGSADQSANLAADQANQGSSEGTDSAAADKPADQPTDTPADKPAAEPATDAAAQPSAADPAPVAPKPAPTPVLPKAPAVAKVSTPGNKQQAPQVTKAVTPQPTSATPNKDAKKTDDASKTGASRIEPRATQEVVETDDAALDRILAGLSASQTTAIGKVKQYIEAMAPNRPIDPAVGAKHQVGLYRTLYNVINNESGNFDPLWRAILKLVEINRNGVFHPANAYRFIDSQGMTLDKDQLMSFRSLLDLLILTSVAKGRDIAAKTYDFNQALRYAQTENGRARVLKFYGR